MKIQIIQQIIDKLRGKPVRIYAFDKKIKVMKWADIDNSSIVGDYTYIGERVSVTKSTIGRYCSIANLVTIGAGEHDIENISTNGMLCKHNLTNKDCIIGNDVWIGVDSIIRRGVKIGNCAVIGANSFVNKDVPDFAVVAGNPARIIKYRFNEETRIKILESKYWEKEPNEAKKIIRDLQEFYKKSKI